MSGKLELQGRIALVTGGSNGIGAATVRSLAENGAAVVVGYHRGRERAEALVQSLPGDGHSTLQLELENIAQVRAALGALQSTRPRLDILVNSAGFTSPVAHADFDKLTDELFESVLVANARGPYSVIRAALPLLRKSEDAVIVNVSSIAAFTGNGSSIAYCASKAALDTMTISLARVLGPKIRVLAVSPGAVPTEFVAGRSRDAVSKSMATTPLQRIVEVDDVARTIMACITHLKASTGIRVVVDGGRHL